MIKTMRFCLLSIFLLPYHAFAVTASCWNQGPDEAACWQKMEQQAGGQTTAVAYATTDAMSNILNEATQESCNPTSTSPNMSLDDVSLSLRLTCEMNRRLLQASRSSASTHDRVSRADYYLSRSQSAGNAPMDVRGGTTAVVHIHPSRRWESPIPETSHDETPLSIFHAPLPSTGNSKMGKGVKRWGPDLLEYLQSITTALGVQDNPLVLALSILFLDKACSIETLRQNGDGPCPYLLPRTIHRLLVTSLWIATQAVYPDKPPAQMYASLAMCSAWKSLKMGPGDLQRMEDLMRRAMGPGEVSEYTLGSFCEFWEQTFGSREASSSRDSGRIKIRTRKNRPQQLHSPSDLHASTAAERSHQAAPTHEQDYYHTMTTDQARDGAPSSPSGTADAALQCW